MNIFLISISFLCVSALHYVFFSYEVNNTKPKPIAPKYQKVSVQMASLQKPIEKPKEEPKKKIIKEEVQEVKKKSIKKPIKKDAKRKIVQKPKKSVKKRVIKKKIEPKKVEKQIIKKLDVEPIKTKKEPTKNIHTENKAQSLAKLKAFKKNYLIQLRAKIDSNKKYPKISKRLNEQGQVTVSFKVLKSGEFRDMRITKSSGKKRLDKAALKALEETKSFKAIPQELNKSFFDINLPITFKLQ